MPDNHTAAAIAKRVQHRQMPKVVRLDQLNIQKIAPIVTEFKQTHKNDIQDWQLNLIQTPHQSYKIEADPILVINERQVVKPINEMSLMISAMSDKSEHTAFLCIDKEIYNDPRVAKLIEHLTQSVTEMHHERSSNT